MTTWKLKLMPPNGPVTEKTGLTPEQTLVALADLMYGTFEDNVEPVATVEQGDELTPLAA